jgi:hypothetical protein
MLFILCTRCYPLSEQLGFFLSYRLTNLRRWHDNVRISAIDPRHDLTLEWFSWNKGMQSTFEYRGCIRHGIQPKPSLPFFSVRAMTREAPIRKDRAYVFIE